MLYANNFTSLDEVIEEVREHPLMKDYSLSNIIKKTVRFIGLMGCDALYEHKTERIPIKNNHGVLGCDVVAVQFVEDSKSHTCLRKASGAFGLGVMRYKIVGRDIYVSEGISEVVAAYTTIKVDDEGLPMILDIEQFKRALVDFIKMEYFKIQFECNKITPAVWNEAQQEYSFSAAALNSVLSLPDYGEAENIGNDLAQFVPNDQFITGFENYGAPEKIKVH